MKDAGKFFNVLLYGVCITALLYVIGCIVTGYLAQEDDEFEAQEEIKMEDVENQRIKGKSINSVSSTEVQNILN